jgi:hypothetical protein
MEQSRLVTPDYQAPFQPHPEQLARKAALQRFNRLYVYLPLGFVVALSLLAIILLLVGVLVPGLTGAAALASGLADITIILFTLPMMALCALGPTMLVGMIMFSRNRRQAGIPRMDDGGAIQVLLWKMDNLVRQAQTKVVDTSPKVTKPVIEFNARLAYLQAFGQKVLSYIRRS